MIGNLAADRHSPILSWPCRPSVNCTHQNSHRVAANLGGQTREDVSIPPLNSLQIIPVSTTHISFFDWPAVALSRAWKACSRLNVKPIHVVEVIIRRFGHARERPAYSSESGRSLTECAQAINRVPAPPRTLSCSCDSSCPSEDSGVFEATFVPVISPIAVESEPGPEQRHREILSTRKNCGLRPVRTGPSPTLSLPLPGNERSVAPPPRP